MASSRRLSAVELPSHVIAVVKAHISENSRLCVGLSGGRDSVVLLHLLVDALRHFSFHLSAIHVNHQISPNADRWADFCVSLCEKLGVPLAIERVSVSRESGKGLEASAREMRYAAYRAVDADVIALAHHRNDQAETVLLQALRGAGIKGISAMPHRKILSDGKVIFRPLLDVASDVVADYGATNALTWIEDESNQDTQFTRNFLRHEIFPRLAQSSTENLARLGSHAAEAQALLDELAEIDFAAVANNGRLHRPRLLALGEARAKNLLRFSLVQASIPAPNSAQLQEILQQLQRRQADDLIEITWANCQLRCFGDELFFMPAQREKSPNWQIEWRGETECPLPHAIGTLIMREQNGAGVSRASIAGKKCSVRSRAGGEKFHVHVNRPRRTLKNLLQEAHVPPWERDLMPLFFCDDILVWVSGIGIDAQFVAQAGEVGLCLTWEK
jgi:tRNA(Ile)-lysidine synthase